MQVLYQVFKYLYPVTKFSSMSSSEMHIKPFTKFSFGIAELWKKRELLYFFAWRDIKVKYKDTYLGIAWAILQPLLLTAMFYFIFSRGLHITTGKLPYWLYSLSGLLLWGLFSSGITNSGESMIGNANIIRKIYFPRLIIPLSSVLVAFIDFCFGFLLLLLLLAFNRQHVSWTAIFCFPLGILLAAVSSLGIGALVAALNVKYRDFRYLLPFSIQMLLFSSQIAYSINTIGSTWAKYLLYINPLNGALEIFYYPMQPGTFNSMGVLISLISALLVLTAGLGYFKKTELYFADLL
jgi:lipopolysaccharide transport system permease protein